ncbi:MAG: dihydropteroate synthase [Xanthobacteraceae bacterium]|nr:dihydropteroate synthase [Xanthobacteraceae bacterium]
MLAKPPARILRARGREIPLGGQPLIMGILNVTPDSFSDGGAYASAGEAVAAAQRMIADGASIIDIGGESTRPGHEAVDAATEMKRAIPAVEGVAALSIAPVSIDTYKASVAAAALEAGAHIVNDVWGLSRDPGMAKAIADGDAAAIIMHNREQVDGSLDIFEDMRAFFDKAVEKSLAAGIGEDQIVLDPGIGFGKTLEQNLEVLGNLAKLNGFGFPVLLGASRKSFINKISPSDPGERIGGSVVTTVFASLANLAIIRVHDVATHMQALKIAEAAIASAR